ncbi:MAG: phosphatidylserine decarboxylase [Clostridia bacterium]|nr:phosphatidylserine decarboxylase [Clostridia bacterium]
MYYDLKTDSFVKEETKKSLQFMYNNVLGRVVLKMATGKPIAKVYARYMNSKQSRIKIKGFVRKNKINLEEYKDKKYTSFNDFFIREIKDGKRKIEEGFIAVCDAKLSVYKIDEESKFYIKNSIYTVEELIGENRKYKYALVYRLCVDDYHHYIFPDDGEVVSKKHINGVLHTVQPIAQKKYKVFHENTREITFLNCKELGDVCYIEVGAMMIGKIVNLDKTKFKKGEEKGHFEFGGSTVIVLINKDIEINEKIIENSEKDIETIVKLGQKISK